MKSPHSAMSPTPPVMPSKHSAFLPHNAAAPQSFFPKQPSEAPTSSFNTETLLSCLCSHSAISFRHFHVLQFTRLRRRSPPTKSAHCDSCPARRAHLSGRTTVQQPFCFLLFRVTVTLVALHATMPSLAFPLLPQVVSNHPTLTPQPLLLLLRPLPLSAICALPNSLPTTAWPYTRRGFVHVAAQLRSRPHCANLSLPWQPRLPHRLSPHPKCSRVPTARRPWRHTKVSRCTSLGGVQDNRQLVRPLLPLKPKQPKPVPPRHAHRDHNS